MPSDWLIPIYDALESMEEPVEVFFRDDDAGWNDPRLFALLTCFNECTLPIDLAVIPTALHKELADRLHEDWQQNPELLGLHQHGYAHCNHETQGRKCEFGSNRHYSGQHHDLQAGRNRLASLLGPALDPFFTPPWNRCNQVTVECLIELGFSALSRNRGATPLCRQGLPELPIDIDWCGMRSRFVDAWPIVAAQIAERLRKAESEPVGIMLHHAVMDAEDLSYLSELLNLFADHSNIRCRVMRELQYSDHGR